MNYMIRKQNAHSKSDKLQLKISTPKTINIVYFYQTGLVQMEEASNILIKENIQSLTQCLEILN